MLIIRYCYTAGRTGCGRCSRVQWGDAGWSVWFPSSAIRFAALVANARTRFDTAERETVLGLVAIESNDYCLWIHFDNMPGLSLVSTTHDRHRRSHLHGGTAEHGEQEQDRTGTKGSPQAVKSTQFRFRLLDESLGQRNTPAPYARTLHPDYSSNVCLEFIVHTTSQTCTDPFGGFSPLCLLLCTRVAIASCTTNGCAERNTHKGCEQALNVSTKVSRSCWWT